MRGRRSQSAAREAELLLNVAGMLTDADVLDRVPVRVYLDLDPVFTQLWHSAEGVDMRLDGHTHFVTIADAIGRPGCHDPELWSRLAADVAAGRARGVAGRDPPRAPRHHHGRALAKLWLDPPPRRPVRPEGPFAAAADRPPQPNVRSLCAGARHSSRRDQRSRRAERERLDSPRSGDGRGDSRRLPPLRAGLMGGVRAHQGGLRGVRTRAGSAIAAPAIWPPVGR